MTTKELAVAYLYDAYNDAEHADRLVQIARQALQDDMVDDAIAMLRRALEPAERSPMRIRDAIEKLEALREPREPGDGYCSCGERLDKEHHHDV